MLRNWLSEQKHVHMSVTISAVMKSAVMFDDDDDEGEMISCSHLPSTRDNQEQWTVALLLC